MPSTSNSCNGGSAGVQQSYYTPPVSRPYVVEEVIPPQNVVPPPGYQYQPPQNQILYTRDRFGNFVPVQQQQYRQAQPQYVRQQLPPQYPPAQVYFVQGQQQQQRREPYMQSYSQRLGLLGNPRRTTITYGR